MQHFRDKYEYLVGTALQVFEICYFLPQARHARLIDF